MVTGAEYGLPERVACPFCEGLETELHSPFGSALSVATYWCRRCHTAFEWVKWEDHAGGSAGGDADSAEGAEGAESADGA